MIKPIPELVSSILEAINYHPELNTEAGKQVTLFTMCMPAAFCLHHKYSPECTVTIEPFQATPQDDLQIGYRSRSFIFNVSISARNLFDRFRSREVISFTKTYRFDPCSYAGMCDLVSVMISDANSYIKTHIKDVSKEMPLLIDELEKLLHEEVKGAANVRN